MDKKDDKQKSLEFSHEGCGGDFHWVDVDQLKIDPSYQRDELSDRELQSIIKVFDWNAFGTLNVMCRASGALFVVDGQQRLLAARNKGIKRVPCFIFESRGARHEAREFLATNTRRRAVSALDKFAAAVMARREPEKTIKHWLDSKQIIVTKAPDPGSVAFVNLLVRLWHRNKEASKRAILTQLEILDDEPLTGLIHSGLWWLENSELYTYSHIKKLRTIGGKTALFSAINKFKIELYGGGTPSEKIAGIAILRLINKGKRNKVGSQILKA